MLRTMIHDMPWEKIQAEYDSGLTIRDICKITPTCFKTISKAKKLGLFKTRSQSEAGKLSRINKPRDYSEFRKNRSELVNYRANCSFKFNLKDFPNEFDFLLIEKHGWYLPKNRGNNLFGVSRDHAVSVRYGFDNNIPPEHLAHPANCVLMQHNKNVSKGIKNTISYEELLLKIETWNKKYGL
jgi:hypothetical protein